MSTLQDIYVPDIGEFSDVEIIEIAVAVGNSVAAEDTLLTIESDKATMDIPCPQAGIIRELLVNVGDKVSAGALIARLEAASASPQTIAVAATEKAGSAPVSATPVRIENVPFANGVASDVSPQALLTTAQVPAGPASRRLARELGVDIAQVPGSGKRGRILKDDVKAYAKTLLTQAPPARHPTPSAAPVTELPDLSKFGAIHRQDLSKIEQVTSRNMQRTWSEIPHAWLEQSIDITELEAGRQRLKANMPGLTMTALIVKALALTLAEFPRFNCALDNHTQQIVYRDYLHIGVAVDTPRGLVVAVIRDVDQLNVAAIGAELDRLSQLARVGQLKLGDMQGAGMTVSSLGGLGIAGLQPIVNWPEVAILGVAKATRQPVYIGDVLQPRLIMPVTLGFDHRVINGADGARFLAYLQRLLSDPMMLVALS